MKGVSKVVAVSPVTALVEELDCVFQVFLMQRLECLV